MKIKVERTLSGFRLTFPRGAREFISYREDQGTFWTRVYASEALDIACRLYGARRASTRFIHH